MRRWRRKANKKTIYNKQRERQQISYRCYCYRFLVLVVAIFVVVFVAAVVVAGFDDTKHDVLKRKEILLLRLLRLLLYISVIVGLFALQNSNCMALSFFAFLWFHSLCLFFYICHLVSFCWIFKQSRNVW